ncbi:MAG: tRNA (adenosine(37)-N6)-threonylcarbamoyltransferase complex ATPase subunit type 1 TsaE [Patescibacteria group bacterium]
MQKHTTLNLSQIPDAAKNIAHKLRGGEVLALIGELGSGKTAFARALAKRLKVKNRITSPTFVLMNIFRGLLPKNKKKIMLFHLDLYRTKNISEVRALGITDLWGKKDAVVLIEWADKIKKYLPPNAIMIHFTHGSQN